MEDDSRSFWDQALWVDEQQKPEPQPAETPELFFIFDYELPPNLFPGPAPQQAYEH
jgi:hypothetical protein